jgi:hypothetical protein
MQPLRSCESGLTPCDGERGAPEGSERILLDTFEELQVTLEEL